jgi:hypothetical protein
VRRFLVLLVTAALVVPLAAAAGTYTLHPSGFGDHSYSAWKAGEGLPDTNGTANQALYFQKMVPTPTNAAGVAVINGFEGEPTSALLPLGFWYGTDGHCGAGAPRFNVRIQPPLTTDPASRQTMFVGCAAMVDGGTATAPNGRVFQEKTFAGTLPPGTIASLAIVFDEGNDLGFQGFVYLDNIMVGGHVWTSASDNGNGQTIMQDPTGEDFVSALLGEPLTVAFPR